MATVSDGLARRRSSVHRDIVTAILAYMGAAAILAWSSLFVIFRRRTHSKSTSRGRAIMIQLDWLLVMGLPLVGLAHVGIGSFLSMQAYFGAIFAEGTGAVVGVGLVRNMAPMLTGLVLSVMQSTRTVAELRRRNARGLDHDPESIPDRGEDSIQGITDPASLTFTRIAAAAIAGPILAVWGATVGALVGWAAAKSMLGITDASFFMRFFDMLWVRDVIGLVLKGSGFAAMGALFACHEGLLGATDSKCDLDTISRAAFRSIVCSTLLILLFNAVWFMLVYVSGPPFGPTLLKPPTRG